MRRWDGQPTPALAAQVQHLKGKATMKGESSKRDAAPVSSRKSPRQNRMANVMLDLLEGTSESFLQESLLEQVSDGEQD